MAGARAGPTPACLGTRQTNYVGGDNWLLPWTPYSQACFAGWPLGPWLSPTGPGLEECNHETMQAMQSSVFGASLGGLRCGNQLVGKIE